MRNLLQITDLGSGTVQVSWQRGNAGVKVFREPIPCADPLDDEDREDLRWYLEDFLQFPYGAERWKAEQVERKMEQWGEALFRQIFIKADIDPDPRSFYQEAVREGLDRCELCISSDDQGFLSIPWELLRDPAPGRNVYLSSLLKGLYRQRCEQPIYADVAPESDGPFRILLVIARPYKDDVAMGMVARPIVEALRPMRGVIDLELLRPPTFIALQEKLTENPGYYRLVHFDGHGTFVGKGGPGHQQFGIRPGFGHLVFETEHGGEHVVTSDDLGQALQNARVPLFVMNACQSAREGRDDPFSSVASRLVAIGAKGVVGMSYSVYATTASKFMQRFYAKLVQGSTLSEAVAAGRMRLHTDKTHTSAVGPIELHDWMVPTLYQQEIGFVPVDGQGRESEQEDTDAEGLIHYVHEKAPMGKFGFIGRDSEILRIERALRNDNAPWVIVTGMGGIGKTELAYGFARWYAETGGCPCGISVASFKEKADIGEVIGSIAGYGTDFSMLRVEEQKKELVKFLKQNPCLLVWDNFETVAGYPDRDHAYAFDEERAQLSGFLEALRGGKSRVVITTRHTSEDWLGIAASLVEIGGLTKWDAGQMAANILRTVGKKPDDFRDDTDFDELLGLLRGHPRSMEVVLPLLRTQSPGQVIDELQYKVGDSTEKLADASLRLAFSRLSERARAFLPIAGLFSSYITTYSLSLFAGPDSRIWDPYPVRPEKIPDEAEWEAILKEASRAGLLRMIDTGLYELHPTVPIFLRSQVASNVGTEALERLDEAFVRIHAEMGALFLKRARSRESFALAFLRVQEANLSRALGLAERQEAWLGAQAIVQTLQSYYDGEGRFDEWKALRKRLLNRVGREPAPEAQRNRANLWMFLLGDEANSAMGIGNFDYAEKAYKRILDYLVSLNEPAVAPQMASAYHQLGIVSQERHQYDEAEKCCRKALEVYERPGFETFAAGTYHQMGIISEKRHQYDEAERWYQKALEIDERLGSEISASSTYHQTGMIAEKRHQYGEAEVWYRKALEIQERLGLEKDVSGEYHQLGVIAEARDRYGDAEELYRKALEIEERLGLKRRAAGEYHQLGILAHKRCRYDEAEVWYRKALAIKEQLGLEGLSTETYHQMGRLAEERNRYDEADRWYRQALNISEQYDLHASAAFTYHQLGILAERRSRHEEAERWFRKALDVFERLRFEPPKVTTLGQLSIFLKDRKRYREAVGCAGEGFLIAAAHNMDIAIRLAYDLGQLIEIMGGREFAVAWSDAFPEVEPPMEAIRELLEQIQAGETQEGDTGADDEEE